MALNSLPIRTRWHKQKVLYSTIDNSSIQAVLVRSKCGHIYITWYQYVQVTEVSAGQEKKEEKGEKGRTLLIEKLSYLYILVCHVSRKQMLAT